MKRDNLVIYVGTAIFFILAISIGIVLFMTTKTNKVEEIGEAQEQKKSETEMEEEKTESASTQTGKTVEEQKQEQEQIQNQSKPQANNTTKKEEKSTDTENKNTESAKTESKVTETKKEITFLKPVEGEIICEFAKDNLIYSETLKEWITHTAIDIKADKTSVIKTAADGIVKSIVNDPRYGLTVVIEHDDGYETVYSNLLTAEFVVEGEEVKQGQTIGTAGNTASFESSMESHLHFELLKDGEYLDPNIYLK